MSKNHYKVLNIDPKLQDHPLKPDRLKTAYRQALLSHHPDKTIGSIPGINPAQVNTPTIDEITLAYQILSDSKARVKYDRELRLAEDNFANNDTTELRTPGLEVIDLDEMIYNEQENTWTRECRCGTGGGYVLTEEDLEKVANNVRPGEPQVIMVGCEGCSLSLKVEFAMAED